MAPGILQSNFAPAPLVALATALCIGIFAGRQLTYPSNSFFLVIVLVGVLLTLASAWSLAKTKLAAASGTIIVAFFCAGMALSLVDGRGIAPNRIARLYDGGIITPGDPVEITGVVEGQPEPAPQSFYLTLRAQRITIKGIAREVSGTLVLLALAPNQQVSEDYDRLDLRHGARVRVMAAIDREQNFRNPGVAPFTEYLERKGYDATGVIKSPLLMERLDDEPVFLPLAWLYDWRTHLQKEFAGLFSPETAGVLDAALLGNRYNISQAAAERFRAGGTFHVLVISGMQISFVGGVVFLILRRLTRRKFLQVILAASLLWAYTLAVGADASVARAALMFTLVALSPVVLRQANSLNVVGAATLALLVWRPADLFDPSFQLTFLSVLMIVSLAVPLWQRMKRVGAWRPAMETPYPPDCRRWFRVLSEALFWSERGWRKEIAQSNLSYRLFKTPAAAKLERWHVQRGLRFIMSAILVSASVQLGLLPLLVIYFHRLSPSSLIMNIFVGALMAVLGFLALAAVMLSHVSAWLAMPLIETAERVSWAMIHLVDPFSRLGIASMRLPHYSGRMAGVYFLYYVPLAFLVFALGRWNPLRPASITRIRSKTFSSGNLRLAAAALALFLLAIVSHPFSAERPDGMLHIDFLDVGQGDAALLTMPDGTTLLVDGGGRPSFNRGQIDNGETDVPFERDVRSIGESVVSEYLWSRGLDQVDYILASHADADHIDGLSDVARNFTVRAAIVARAPMDDPEYARFMATMRDRNVPVQQIGAGDLLRFGNVVAEVLWPPAARDPNAPSRNNDSVILRIRYGDRTLLLTGDIEKQGEVAVLKEGVDVRCDLIKVAHHGSKTSSTEAFVAATQPALAIISVGRTSIFGHPNQEVVARWRAIGAEVMTTGRKGTISIITNGRDLKVGTFVR